ncbi:MAG: hypothetical protein PHY08_06560 [Candidatus Cloacimonetes bacterium]|jgi:uncharacterized membrane protein|nr:hypothetical protein [Candidatus Cloacimonadota bacterium]MDD4156218.1 hypothetical protein [Candidatus Cloacimonadota bacterium]
MKKSIAVLIIMTFIYLISVNINQYFIARCKNKQESLNKVFAAVNDQNKILLQTNQKLKTRERIIAYATEKLNMKQVEPDVILSGSIIKEIKEESTKNQNIIYSLIDFVSPTMEAITLNNEY